jgi:hypothetical protein
MGGQTMYAVTVMFPRKKRREDEKRQVGSQD